MRAHLKVIAITTVGYTVAISLGICIGVLLAGCPKPTPDPVFPTIVDASVIDAPPANCASFAGRYVVSDKPVPGSQSCAKATNDVIHIEVPGEPDPDSNQWDVVIFNDSGQQLMGVAKQVEGRPYVCRFVADLQGTFTGITVINRDLYFGEQTGVGFGEAIVKSTDCLWQSVSAASPSP